MTPRLSKKKVTKNTSKKNKALLLTLSIRNAPAKRERFSFFIPQKVHFLHIASRKRYRYSLREMLIAPSDSVWGLVTCTSNR